MISEYKYESNERIFQQWNPEQIRFCYQGIWLKEIQEYEAEEVNKRRHFEDEMLWQQSMFEWIFEEECVEDKIRMCFSTNSIKVKEKLQQQQVKKYGSCNKQV